jgi:hypothetical protein
MDDEQIKKLISNASIDTLVERIKESDIYPTYEKAVRDGAPPITRNILGALSMLQMLSDKEFDIQVSSVALDMLFNAIDLRLSSEIRNSNVEEIE